MSNIGVFLVLTAIEVSGLRGMSSPDDQFTWVNNQYGSQIDGQARFLDVGQAWDAMHRCLGDGTLGEDLQQYPLRIVVLGGEPIGDNPYFILRVKTPEQVRVAAKAMKDVVVADFRKCYFALPPEEYLISDEQDFEYTWDNFEQVRAFYQYTAERGDFILFSADQ
jgi:hypothetical protein